MADWNLIGGLPPARPPIGSPRGVYKLGAEDLPQCQGCGMRHWLVGRLLAECARCAMAIPLTD